MTNPLMFKTILEKIQYDNYMNQSGNALTNTKGYMEGIEANINNGSPIKFNNDMIDTAVANMGFEVPDYGQERKLQGGTGYTDYAGAAISGTALKPVTAGKAFSPIELNNDIRNNKLAMGQGLLGLLANKPKGGMLRG